MAGDRSRIGPRERYGWPTHRSDGGSNGTAFERNKGGGKSLRLWLAVSAFLVGATGFFFIQRADDRVSSAPGTTVAVSLDDGSDADVTAPLDEDGSASPDVAPSTADDAIPGPYIRASLSEDGFVLSGVVPTAALAGGLLQAAEAVYAPRVRSELIIDNQLEPVEWLMAGPVVVGLLGTAMTDGTILLSEGQISVSGQAPSQASVDRLEQSLAATSGLPVVVGEIDITNLGSPHLVLAASEGQVTLSGVVPTDAIRADLVEGARAVYGEGNVVDELAVDDMVHTALWMFSGGTQVQLLSAFSDYEIRIADGSFVGFVSGGFNFEMNSAEIKPEYARVLEIGIGSLARDPSVLLVIEGHTDSSGPDELNLELSRQRATAVAAYYIAAGIDPGQLTAVGLGETTPIASNDTEEGRARNRRIEIKIATGL